jgi:ABC-2 type transport system permease protein
VTSPARALRALVRAQLRMTIRGRASQAFAGALAGRPVGMLWLFAMYAAVGAAAVPAARAGADPFTFALLTQAITWALCGVSLTSEAGDALFQPAERDVLGHRPVAARTLLVSKALVLMAFVAALGLALNLAPIVTIAWRDGAAAALVHAVVVVAAVGVLTTAVVTVYGLVARVVPRERFEGVSAGSQVVLAVAFIGITMVLGRLVWGGQGLHVDPATSATRWLPPAWFAALEATLAGAARPGTGVLAGVALGLVVAALVAPAATAPLARALARIDEERTLRPVRAVTALEGPLFRRWLRDPVERATFRLATAYLRRDRDVRLRLDPSLVTFTLLPLAGLVFDEHAGGHLVPLTSVCLLGMLPGVVLEALRISSHPAASELFAVAPIASAGAVFHGVRKAAVWHVSRAMVVALALAVAIVPAGVPLAVPGLIAFPTFTLLPGLFGVYVPLAIPKARGQQATGNVVLLTASTVLLAVLVDATLRASRAGRLGTLYLGEIGVMLVADRALRRLIARRSLTTSRVSPTYGAG